MLMPGLEALRVLVVDDQESMQMLIGASLRGLGLKDIVCAGDGVEALEALKRRTADLILLDLEMPRMGGLDTLKAIRADANLKRAAVIMVTGRADAGVVREIVAVGINGFLIKPVSADALKARIKALYQRA